MFGFMIVLSHTGPDGPASGGCADFLQHLIYIGISVLMGLQKAGNDCILKMGCISK